MNCVVLPGCCSAMRLREEWQACSREPRQQHEPPCQPRAGPNGSIPTGCQKFHSPGHWLLFTPGMPIPDGGERRLCLELHSRDDCAWALQVLPQGPGGRSRCKRRRRRTRWGGGGAGGGHSVGGGLSGGMAVEWQQPLPLIE